MTKISAASPNEEEQEQEISIREFMRTQKQFMENMQLMFQKHATQRQRHSPVGLIGQGLMRITLMMHHSRRVTTELLTIPGAARRKRKRVNQINQNSQDTVTLHPSDSDSYLSEDSTCQRKDSEDPLSKYSKVDSDVEVRSR